MNFVDLVKKSVINEFTGTISIDKILVTPVLASSHAKWLKKTI